MNTPESRRDFWRRWTRLMITIAGQNIIVYGVNLADNIMIGQLGAGAELAISGVFIVNQIQFLLQMMLGGIADGTVVMCSRFWGEKNIAAIKKTAAFAMHFGLILSGLMLAAALLVPGPILSVFTDKPDVIAEATRYLRIVCFTYVFFAATQVLLGMLRSVECAMIGFVNSCAALVINLVLNYILIFGHFGAPAMGVEGAALATLVSRVIEFGIVVFYLTFMDRKLHVRLADFFRTEREIIGKFMKFSLPVFLSGTSWGIAMGLQTAILGHIDNDSVITANSIASTLFQILSVFSYGAATAASVMIGKTIGEGADNRELLSSEIRHRSSRMQGIFLLLGVLTGLSIFLAKDLIIGFYDVAEGTRAMALAFMTVLSVTAVGTSYQMPCLTGIVRGGGDTKFVLFNDIIFMWCIVLPAAFIAFRLNLSPVIIFACLKSDQILKCFVAVVKVNRYKWIRKI